MDTRSCSRRATASASACSPTASCTWSSGSEQGNPARGERRRPGPRRVPGRDTRGDGVDARASGAKTAPRPAVGASARHRTAGRDRRRSPAGNRPLRPARLRRRPRLPGARHPLLVVPARPSVPAAAARSAVRLPRPPAGGIRATEGAHDSERAVSPRRRGVHPALQRHAAAPGSHARPVEDALAEPAPLGTLVNYPARLAARRVAPGATLVGRRVRDEPGDPELDSLDRGASRRGRTLRSEASCPRDPMSSARSPAGSGEPASEP